MTSADPIAAAPGVLLVTGSTGFTGTRLLDVAAEQGWETHGISRDPGAARDVVADLLDPAALAAALERTRPDVVVHLAGITFPAHPSPSEIYQANVVGTANLVHALSALRQPPRLTLIASSATVYAPRADGTPIDEDQPLRPLNAYGVSKLAVEHMARLAGDRMPVRVTRPFNYTGPGQTGEFLVPKIVRHFAEGAERMQIGNLDLDRDISSLDDVVEAYMRLITIGGNGPAVNLCSGEAVPLRRLVEWLTDISGRSLEVVVDPAFVRAGEPRTIVGDRSRLDATIGTWVRRPLRDTLAEMYEGARSV